MESNAEPLLVPGSGNGEPIHINANVRKGWELELEVAHFWRWDVASEVKEQIGGVKPPESAPAPLGGETAAGLRFVQDAHRWEWV